MITRPHRHQKMIKTTTPKGTKSVSMQPSAKAFNPLASNPGLSMPAAAPGVPKNPIQPPVAMGKAIPKNAGNWNNKANC